MPFALPRSAFTLPMKLLPFLFLPIAAFAGDARSPRLDAICSWIGNTYPGHPKWVQQDIDAMCVTPDGTVFTNAEWDEGGGQAGQDRDGALLGYAGHTHGWGFNGGKAIAVNSKYVFIGSVCGNEGGGLKDPDTWPPKGHTWFGISRRLRSDFTKPAPFEGGKGGKGNTLKQCFLPVVDVEGKESAPITGLAADEQRLYVSDPRAGKIRVLDAETMRELEAWPAEQPGQLALDRHGLLWMLEKGYPSRLRAFDASGGATDMITFPAEVIPIAFALDPSDRVLVADDGVSQQLLTYRAKDGQLVHSGAIGVKNGIYASPAGAFGNLRFNRISALGLDNQFHFYVAHHGSSGGGSTVLESYDIHADTPSTPCWRLFGLEFVDLAAPDPTSDTDVFTKEEHFRLDYENPPGHEWGYAGYTIHRFKYPDDPRLHIWSGAPWVRRIGGRRFLFVNDMSADYLQVYRFDAQTDGEIAVPSGLFAKKSIRSKESPGWPVHQPARGEWIWRDANGNGALDDGEFTLRNGEDAPAAQGWWVDSTGNVWLATEKSGIRLLPQQGLDPAGNPTWSYASMRTYPHPAAFETVKRLRYDSEHDVMYLGGTTKAAANQHWKPMGPVIARYDGWMKAETSGAMPAPTWTIVMPYERGAKGHESCEPMGFDAAGDYLFIPYTGASKEMSFSTGHVEVIRAADGQSVGHFEPSAEIGEVGLQDLRETLTAQRRANGEYLIFLEDDYKAKTVLYRWWPNPADQPHLQADRNRSATRQTEYVEVNIALDDARSSSKCPLKVSVKNIGAEALRMTDWLNGVYSSQINVQSRVGEICPKTKKGEWVFAPLVFAAGSTHGKLIEPGSTFDFTIPLQDFFELRPGNWLLDCKIKVIGKDADRSAQLPQLEFYLPESEKK
jgi:hypothetical protein